MTATAMRTHRCGALRVAHVEAAVRLAGWLHRVRNLGGLIFFDLRDRDGIVQVAFGPDWTPPGVLARAAEVHPESVVLVEGRVRRRPEEARNPEMATGEVEVEATGLEIVGPADPTALPIPVWRTKGEELPAEERRLTHRHLDLRRPELHAHLVLRHRLLQRARCVLSELGFLEVETPILTRPTPEGARDFLVPSRLHRGQFYALPQSPQIYKQILMVAGFDRYFQIARCFRDEDFRADRQAEFTQIDLEASFVTPPDVYGVLERLFIALWGEGGHDLAAPFPRLGYREALERFGSDKPDLRFDLELVDLGGLFRGRGFRAFEAALEDGGRVRGIRVPGGAALSRKQVDGLVEEAKHAGLGGLATLRRRGDDLSGPLASLEGLTPEVVGLADGDLLVVAAGPDGVVSPALARVRAGLIGRLGIVPSRSHAFAWIEDFPLFEPDPETDQWVFAHHPFTAPHPEDVEHLLHGAGESIRAQHYDLVYNGHELGSGSIRITDLRLQLHVLGLLGIPEEEAWRRFGFLLRGLAAGAPPHGGFAVGFDRTVMLLAGAGSLRDVIAFPKTTQARALFEDAPCAIDRGDLRALGLTIDTA